MAIESIELYIVKLIVVCDKVCHDSVVKLILSALNSLTSKFLSLKELARIVRLLIPKRDV
jgi:hypothetical protein